MNFNNIKTVTPLIKCLSETTGRIDTFTFSYTDGPLIYVENSALSITNGAMDSIINSNPVYPIVESIKSAMTFYKLNIKNIAVNIPKGYSQEIKAFF